MNLILTFLCGSAAGTFALLFMQACNGGARRMREADLLASLIELRRLHGNGLAMITVPLEEYKAMLARADTAIAYSTEALS
jgi:hypothetical protein